MSFRDKRAEDRGLHSRNERFSLPERPWSDWCLLGGLALCAVLEVLIVVRYPGDIVSRTAHLEAGLIAELLLAAVAAFVVWSGKSPRSQNATADIQLGNKLGAVCGFAWVLEISFNNFIDPSVSTGSARFYVDNGTWALISLAILVSAFVRVFRADRIAAGIRVGLWSGLTSGLIACLMGLLLVTVGMRFLLRDPLNIAEYAVRGTAGPTRDMATYFAYETMYGAIGHLIEIGIAMSAILGAIGGAGAKVTRRLPPFRP